MTAFEVLYEENRAFLYKYLLKLCKNSTLAEELTQETFFRAYMNFGRLRDSSKAAIWLCQIAKNAYFAFYNEQKKTVDFNEAELPAAPDTAETVLLHVLSDDALARLDELEEPYKEVFRLAVIARVSLKDISALFGKSESWARVTLYRAKKQLRERMK